MTKPLMATSRLQLTPAFTFAAARAVLPYLHAAGISHVYLSPVLEARAGSTHGYDVTDPTRIRAALGGEEEFRRLAETAGDLGLGLIIDIVPNHMAADPSNPWWRDVLRNGPASEYAAFFDIDWEAGDGKLILPVLGCPLEEAIREGQIRIVDGREPHLAYFEREFPLADATHNGGALAVGAALQHSRLVYWRRGATTVNYRRFFDIGDLAALKVENDRVFDDSHAVIVRLAREGLIDGVRVDHVDGLADPAAYLKRLARTLDAAAPKGRRVRIFVEKILSDDEELAPDWPVAGTTGYESLNVIHRLFVDPPGFAVLEAGAHEDGIVSETFHETATGCKAWAASALFAPDLDRLEGAFGHAFDATPAIERPSDADLRRSLIAVSAALDVYRTYITSFPPTDADRNRLDRALAAAGPVHPAVAAILTGSGPFGGSPEALKAVRRWQQFTGPLAAKGVEDTALYRHIVLASLNEVGGHPDMPVDAVSSFHESMAERSRIRPQELVATATHDTKRGEDPRARIAVLSELPGEWRAALGRWRSWHAPLRAELPEGSAPIAADESLFYQSLLGIWPCEERPLEEIATRLGAYLVKAAREAKVRTSWLDPNAEYEDALRSYINGVLLDEAGALFRADAQRLRRTVAFSGAVSSLAQVVIKTLAPGTPDFYQGTELWDLSLVDPDNRRPVNFELRRTMLTRLSNGPGAERKELLNDLMTSWPDGRIKMFVTQRALGCRARLYSADPAPGYRPAHARGERADHVCAFVRDAGSFRLLVIAPRLVSRLGGPGEFPVGAPTWKNTVLCLPEGSPEEWHDEFGGQSIASSGGRLPLAAAFGDFPVAILTSGRANANGPGGI